MLGYVCVLPQYKLSFKGEMSRMKKILMLLFVPVLLTGCASTYNMTVLKAPDAKLSPSYSVVIATPENGRFGSVNYYGSGEMTARAFKNEFLKNSNKVNILSKKESPEVLAALDRTYYVEPKIIHWEERATEWSGKPDKIEIKVSVYNAGESDPLSSVIFTGKSKWLTLGGDHPQELLPVPVSNYLETLY